MLARRRCWAALWGACSTTGETGDWGLELGNRKQEGAQMNEGGFLVPGLWYK
jgi:hypothetical protein